MSSFSTPGWAKKATQEKLSATNPVPIDAIPIIHTDDPGQAIQGGAPGEYYHLTEAEHTALLAGLHKYVSLEMVFSEVGEIVLGQDGDCVHALVSGNHNFY